MPHYTVRRSTRGPITGIPRSPALQLCIGDGERVMVFSSIPLRQRLAICWNLLRGGMTIVEAPSRAVAS